MKRITSTLLVAAIPALSALGVLPGWNSAPDPQLGQRGGQRGGQAGRQTGEQDGAAGAGTAKEGDETPPPEGFNPRGKTTYDIFGRRTTVRGNTFEERIKGGWRLSAMTLGGITASGSLVQGFLHIGDSFVSMEIHALWEDGGGAGGPGSDIHATFTSEYSFNTTGKLTCATVIGSYLDDATGELTWERTGFEREYMVREIQNQLELTFQAGSGRENRLVFESYVPRQGGERDVFGRPIGINSGATDIYGRKNASERRERDIFGRPDRPEPGSQPGEEEAPAKKPVGSPPKGPGAGGAPLGNRGGR